jgi:hypothetical protein
LQTTETGERHGCADLHIHTAFSDGADSPSEVLRRARQTDMDVIAITDHDTIDGALVAWELAMRSRIGPEVIIGEEVSSRDGHILALFVRSLVPPGLSARETVAAIQEQGGIAIAAHPFWRHEANGARGWVYSVGDEITAVPFDAVEVMNGGLTPSMIKANARAARAARELLATEVGGSDAHVSHAVGWAYTRFLGTTARDLGDSIIQGHTQAARSRPGIDGIGRYALWSLGRLRPQPAQPVAVG